MWSRVSCAPAAGEDGGTGGSVRSEEFEMTEADLFERRKEN